MCVCVLMHERERQRQRKGRGENVQLVFVDKFIDFNLNSVLIQRLGLDGESSTSGLPQRPQNDTWARLRESINARVCVYVHVWTHWYSFSKCTHTCHFSQCVWPKAGKNSHRAEAGKKINNWDALLSLSPTHPFNHTHLHSPGSYSVSHTCWLLPLINGRANTHWQRPDDLGSDGNTKSQLITKVHNFTN